MCGCVYEHYLHPLLCEHVIITCVVLNWRCVVFMMVCIPIKLFINFEIFLLLAFVYLFLVVFWLVVFFFYS